ncbi:ABC transporter permease [Catalinimonas niigatensis]|uniref:ABC transporter permease n=1 Tax=Catalinimonas niigatensis TaxID=1397264 RepID=UPI002666A1EE|nr:ABC transporter permease [Catalinimonas niigatensis]WPP48686.1 FtsX-like permease family protein [Catalinimonas niigatensis]
MLKNYIIVALRNLKRNRVYAAVNILGLALGLTTALIIFLLIRYELSFEQMHTNGERIYRLVQTRGERKSAPTPYPAPVAVRMDYGSQLEKVTGIYFDQEVLVRIDENKFIEDVALFADSSFLEVFDYGYGDDFVIEGDLERSMREPGFAVLTKSLADKYFGNENPLGKRLSLRNRLDVEVGAVVKDPPVNTHVRFDLLVSLESLTPGYIDSPLDSWGFVAAGYTYMLLPEGASPESMDFTELVKKYYNEESWSQTSFQLQALKDIHFDETYGRGGLASSPVSQTYLWVVALVGIFIMIIACINFINLSTAISLRKSKEVGVRKALGALRANLIGQFSGEALLVTLISFAIAFVAMMQILPSLNNYLQKGIHLDITSDFFFWLYALGLICIVALLSGLYPAFVVSGFQPVKALRNTVNSHHQSSIWMRRGLVVFQFLIAQVLIIATLIVANQMDFIRSKSLGFDQEAIINVGLPDTDSVKLDAIRTRLHNQAGIETFSLCIGAPNAESVILTPYDLAEKGIGNESAITNVKPTDHHYLDVYGVQLLAGRWFEEYDLGSPDTRFVVNERFVSELGYASVEEALGASVITGFGNSQGEIIGVVANFHESSLHNEMMPVCFTTFSPLFYSIGIKLSAGNYTAGIEKAEEVWTSLYPDGLFQYDFMDAQLASLYEEDMRTYTLFRIFSAVAIFIGCLGLFGLISFLVEQKRKEVSVRKVLGASVAQIVFLFSKEFTQLVLLAFVFAVPLAWYLSENWLENFAYQTEIGIDVFIIGGLAALLIAFLSVAWQSVKAARENPAKSLRND